MVFGKKGGYFRLGIGAEIGPLEMGRKSPELRQRLAYYTHFCSFGLASQMRTSREKRADLYLHFFMEESYNT